MKNTKPIYMILVVLALTGCSNNESAGTQGAAAPASDSLAVKTPGAANAVPMDSTAMAKAWETYMLPGEMHQWMAGAEGKWKAELSFWSGPGALAQTGSEARVEIRNILGGRYQETIYKGRIQGMDFEGRGLLAYDNAAKKFQSTWIDNMGTGMMYMEGSWDAATKTLNSSGTVVDPLTGNEKKVRETLKVVDEDHQVMEMFDTKDGSEYKSMEIRLSRK